MKRILWILAIACCCLEAACARDLEQMYRQMLTDRKSTAEIRAFLSQHPECVDVADNRSETALHIAAERNDTSLAEFLISFEADVNASAQHKKDTSPLASAIRFCSKDMVRLLLEHGAEADGLVLYALRNSCSALQGISAPRPGGMGLDADSVLESHRTDTTLAFVDMLLEHGANVNEHDALGNTALHDLAAQGSTRTIQEFIARGARPDTRNASGLTPRDLAALYVGVTSLACENFLPEFEKIVADRESKRVVYPTMIRKIRDFLEDFIPKRKSLIASFEFRRLLDAHGITAIEMLEYGRCRAEASDQTNPVSEPELETRLQVYRALLISPPEEENSDLPIVILAIIVLTAAISTAIIVIMKRLS